MKQTDNEQKGGRNDAPLVVLAGITKRFPGVVANESVDLTLQPGEIHALIGENGAGKSTLMKVLYGLYPPDLGDIYVRGEKVRIASPKVALKLGIGMVHQHFALVDRFTVAENLVLGEEGGPLLDMKRAERRVAELTSRYGMSIDAAARIEDLSVGEEQRVEILKALYRGVDILILDEPTAVLTPGEATELFRNLRALRDQGKTIVFISHKLDEVLHVADRITVLRRGKVVGETTPQAASKEKLAEMMVGRPVLFRLEKPQIAFGDPALMLEDVSVEDKLKNFSLQVREGEILGIAGVEGNGQRELAEAIMGLRPVDGGRIILAGHDVAGLDCAERRRRGISFVPEDRHERGLVLGMSLWENSLLGHQNKPEYARSLGVLLIDKIKNLAKKLVRAFDIRTRDISDDAVTLSGGNQQKLILARELEDDPKLLVAHQPTRGLDVGAIEFVWKQLLRQKDEGRAVLLISAELDEIYELSDRIVVIYEGRVTGEFRPDVSAESLGLAMTGKTGTQKAG